MKVGASYPGRSAYLPLCYRRREVSGWKIHWPTIKAALLNGQYMPQAPAGGVRALGIPTVLDRLIQQALLQTLCP